MCVCVCVSVCVCVCVCVYIYIIYIYILWYCVDTRSTVYGHSLFLAPTIMRPSIMNVSEKKIDSHQALMTLCLRYTNLYMLYQEF